MPCALAGTTHIKGGVDGGGVVRVAGQLGVDGFCEEAQVHVDVWPHLQGTLQKLQGMIQYPLHTGSAPSAAKHRQPLSLKHYERPALLTLGDFCVQGATLRLMSVHIDHSR